MQNQVAYGSNRRIYKTDNLVYHEPLSKTSTLRYMLHHK